MSEDTEGLSNLSTSELLAQTTKGPKGTLKGSHLDPQRVKTELRDMTIGALRLARYKDLLATNPELAQKHPLHDYFNPEITPRKDREEGYDNPIIYRRHDIFEREGEFITDLRRKGGETIGEVQDLLRLWTSQLGWIRKKDGGQLSYFNPMYDNLVNTVALTLEGTEEEKKEKAQGMLTKFGEEVLYYNFTVRFFQKKSELVGKFSRSKEFAELSQDFKKAHVGAALESDEVVATAMLAGHYLSRFEGEDPTVSPSQKFIFQPNLYHQTIAEFIKNNSEKDESPPDPTGKRDLDLTKMINSVESAILKKHLPKGFKGTEEDVKSYDAYLKERDSIFEDVAYPDLFTDKEYQNLLTIYYKPVIYNRLVEQIHRGTIDKEILRRFNETLKNIPGDRERSSKALRKLRGTLLNATLKDVIIDPEGRRNLIQTAIGNVMMGIAVTEEGPTYGAARWMAKSEGYTGKDNSPLPEIDRIAETPTPGDLQDIIRDVFDGQSEVEEGRQFQAQAEKIYKYAPKILRYLQNGEGVPDEVRDKIDMLMDTHSLMEKVARRFGPRTDQDVNYVNRFYRTGGVDEAQKSMLYRAVFDFMEGVQTNLILAKRGTLRKVGRVAGGVWVNEDFSHEDGETIGKALDQTLTDGKNQILKYDNRLDKKTREQVDKLAANKRKRFERYMWDGYDMRFLRWSPRRGSDDNMLQIAIECFCPLRDTVFNPRTIQQW